MKKLLFFLLVLGLTACSAAPTQPPAPQPTAVPPTPQVVIVTVEVPVQPTQAPPSPIPTVTPLPPPTEIPTQAVEPTQPAAAAPTSAQPTANGPLSIPAELNGPVFANITVSSNVFSLRCQPKEITFDLYATDIYITRVDFYYRIRDKHSNYIPEWSLGGTLETDGGNHFWLTYSGESVKADDRKAFGWFDLQFVGMNKLGQVVGRSEKIVGLISYNIDCP